MLKASIKLSAEKNRATVSIFLFLLFFGSTIYMSMSRESKPDVKIPVVMVNIPKKGLLAENAENLIVKPVENKLSDLAGIKEVRSSAFYGGAHFFLEFLIGEDIEKMVQKVRNKINDVKAELPKNLGSISVNEIELSKFPILNVCIVANLNFNELTHIIQNLKDELLSSPAIADVKIVGLKKEVIEVIVKPEVLELYNLSPNDLVSFITEYTGTSAGATIHEESGNFLVKINNSIVDLEDILNIPIIVEGLNSIKLRELAEVKLKIEDPTSVAEIEGFPAVVLEISKNTSANIIKTVQEVKETVEKTKEFWPPQIKIFYTQDESELIEDMVSELENGVILATILVMLIIFSAVSFRASIMVLLSLPFSFCCAILLLYTLGYTLNIIVLFSLIMTVGMVVDDAIVVSEYADKEIDRGIKIQQAYINAAVRMFWPIFTATLVKIIVFTPMFFWPGMIGKFMRYMPITAISVLSSSLLYSLFFQPALARLIYIFSHRKPKNTKFKKGWYIKSLAIPVQYPKSSLSILLLITSLIYYTSIKYGEGVEFFPKMEEQSIYVEIKSPGNLSLRERETLIKNVAFSIPEGVRKEIKFVYLSSSTTTQQNIIGHINIELLNWKKRRKATLIQKELNSAFKKVRGVECLFREKSRMPGNKIVLEISTQNRELLEYAKKTVEEYLKMLDGIGEIEDDTEMYGMEFVVDINNEVLLREGIRKPVISHMLKFATEGLVLFTYQNPSMREEIDVLLRAPESQRGIKSLERLKTRNLHGEWIPYSDLIKISEKGTTPIIKRKNKKPNATISLEIEEGNTHSKEQQIMYYLNKNKIDGVDISLGGEAQDKAETSSFLVSSFLTVLVIMLIVMLIQFDSYYQSLIIMSAIFLSTTGVVGTLFITSQPFSIVMSGIGTIALAGIVLNNNIIFMDTYKKLRKERKKIDEAIYETAHLRVRPILLTAVTGILGLLPMVFGISINFLELSIELDPPGSAFWKQLATTISGGLAFATLLTLFATPALLSLLRRYDG